MYTLDIEGSSYEPNQQGWLGFRDTSPFHPFLRKTFAVFIWEAGLSGSYEEAMRKGLSGVAASTANSW